MINVFDIISLSTLSLLPSIKNWTHEHNYFFFTFTICIIILIVSLFFSTRLSEKNSLFKKALIVGLISVYYKNIHLFFNVFNSFYIKKSVRTYIDIYNGLLDDIRVYSTDSKRLNPTPNIILCNYTSDRIENFSLLFLQKPSSFMMRKRLCKNFGFDKLCDVITTEEKSCFNETLQKVYMKLKEGKYVISYINKSPYINRHNYGKIHTGMFKIARELGIPITLVAFDNIQTTWYGAICDQPFLINTGPTFFIEKERSINEYVYITRKYFRRQTEKFERIHDF